MLHWGTFQSIHTPHGKQVPQTPAYTDPSGYSFVDAPCPAHSKKNESQRSGVAARRRVAAEFSANVTVEGRFLALHRAAFISLLFPHATERAYRSA